MMMRYFSHTTAQKLYLQFLSLFVVGLYSFATLVLNNEVVFKDGNTSRSTENEYVSPTGSMQAIRAAHTSTLLPNGKVLITGGCTSHGCEAGPDARSAELYDPAKGQFSETASLLGERASSHKATLLLNGTVLITGGWRSRRPTASAELYHTPSGSFVQAGDMLTPRAAHTATLLEDGRVLLVGGYNGNKSLHQSEIYDPASDTFTQTGALNVARAGHIAIKMLDGRVLVIGGRTFHLDQVLDSAEIYDPATGTFQLTGPLSKVRHKHAAALLPDGRVLVIGGSDERDFRGRYNHTEIYNPATESFEAAAQMQSARFKLPDAVVSLNNGEILVAGGDERAEIYNAELQSFRRVRGSMGDGRSFSAATRLGDGSVLVSGGYNDQIRLTNQAWRYTHK